MDKDLLAHILQYTSIMDLSELLSCGWSLADAGISQWRAPAALRERQRRALITQFRHALATVPFYRRQYQAAGLDENSIQTLGDLAKLPRVSRDDIQGNPDLFLTTLWRLGDPSEWYESHTSGSMGKPLQTWFDPECWWQVKYALKARALLAAGIAPYHRVAIVDDVPSEDLERHTSSMALWGEQAFGGRRYLSVFDSPESHAETYARFRPHAIYCFPSYFLELSRFWNASLRRQVPLRALITSGETLPDAARRQLEETFGVPVIDVYGNTEVKDIAWRCRSGHGYHVNMESVLVEILDANGRPAANGKPGEVLVTALTNRAMPLIRYATEDIAVRLPGECPCGRGLERLAMIQGRIADYLPIPAHGNLSPYNLTTALSTHQAVMHFQITLRAGERLEAAVVLRPDAKPDALQSVEQILRQRIGPGFPVKVSAVASIPRDASGKHRAIRVIHPGVEVAA